MMPVVARITPMATNISPPRAMATQGNPLSSLIVTTRGFTNGPCDDVVRMLVSRGVTSILRAVPQGRCPGAGCAGGGIPPLAEIIRSLRFGRLKLIAVVRGQADDHALPHDAASF